MNKTKSSLAFHVSQTEGNTSSKSSMKKLYNSTLPSIRDKIFNEYYFESYVEKYNEKINVWQNYFLCVKRNYLYLYDKKPKLLDKPKEFLFLNNKITLTFHKKLFKLKAIKWFVVNFRINNDALSKSVIEGNNHNLFISLKTQKNYDTFVKVLDNMIKFKQYTNSVSPNQFGILKKEKSVLKNEKKSQDYKKINTERKNNKNFFAFHLKNKSFNQISIQKNLNFSELGNKNENLSKNKDDKNNENDNEIIYKEKDYSPCSKNSKSMKSENKKSNSINNVFTFSKVENGSNNINDVKINNSNSTDNSNSCNQRNNKKLNNLNNPENINQNNIFLEKNECNNNPRKNINYFTINFTDNNSRYKSNNIFDTDESSLTLSEIPNLVYSIKRKREKEKEDTLNFKMQRTKSCLGFNLKNIFLQNNEKTEKPEKRIKTKIKDFHSFCNLENSKKLNLDISNYSLNSKSISNNNQQNKDNSKNTINLSLINHNELNNIEEEKNQNTESKDKEKTNICNNNMSFGSLKSFKSESKEGNDTKNNREYFEGLDIYSYVDASETMNNKSNAEDNNPLVSLKSLNIPNIRNQITKVIEQNEEMISNQNIENNEDSDVIFTPRLMEEIQNHKIISEANSNNKDKEELNNKNNNITEVNTISNIEINNNSQIGKFDILSDKSCSNIINTSITKNKKNMRFSNDLNELIQSLENQNQSNTQSSNNYTNLDENNNTNEIESNNSQSSKNSEEKNKSSTKNKISVNNFNQNSLSNEYKGDQNEQIVLNTNINSKKLTIPFNTFFDINLSFYFMDFNFNFLNSDKSGIKELLYKIDNNLLFIYDSNILNLLLKKLKNCIKYENYSIGGEIEGIITKNKILGKIYESLNNKYAKYFILCEMVAIASKKELSKIIVNAIEIYNKKKEIYPNEPMINFDEYIYDIFNKYLCRNEKNKEYINLYENILPKEIKKIFEINDTEGSIISQIKKNIHPYTLFNSMQYHNKINININLEINDIFDFNSLKPFDKKSNHYISPYILEKWKFKASISTKIILNENNDNLPINNTYNFNTNQTNESFDSNSNINYSRDMSNNSLSIRIDNNNKFRVSLVSKTNDIAINNNLSSFCFNKEKKIYEENKLYEKTEEIQKINLFQNIILNINQNDVNSALKNCEYFLQKYQNSTLFLHPLIFLCLAFIYNKIDGLDSAQKYIKKSLKYLTWLFPYQNCFLFYEIEYRYLLIILNNEENIILNNIENITDIFAQCYNLWKKYYEDKKNSDLKMNEIIFKIYFKITDNEKNNINFVNDLFYNNIKPLMNEITSEKKYNKEKKDKNLNIYWKLFIEFFRNCQGCRIKTFDDLISLASNIDN